jgi:hypothetical protein
MLDKRENIKIINLDSIFLMLILVLGLIIYHNTNNNFSDRNKNSSVTEISLNKSIGTFCSGLRLQAIQKTWISNKDIFKLLSIDNNQFLENKKVDQRISLLQNIRNRTEKIQTLFSRYHLFPTERDEVPILS